MADTDITMGETTLPTNGSLDEEVAVLPPLTEERPPEPTGEPQMNGTPEVPVLVSDPPTEGAPGTNPNASTVILRKGKEVLCRPDEAAGLNKKAQKGYAWVAVGQEQQKEPEAPVLGKRQRKKPNLADFTTPSGKKEKEKGTAGKKLKTSSEEETPAGDPMNTQPTTVSEEKDPKEMDEVARRKMERKKALEDKLNMLADVEKQLAQIIVAKEIAPKTQPVKPRGKPGPKPKVPRTPKAAAKPAVVPVVPTESTPAPILPTPLLAEVLPAASADATEPVPLPGKGRGRARRAAAVAAVAAVNAVVEADVAAAAPLPPRGRGRGQKKRKKATEKDTETPKRRKTTKASTPQTALPPPPPPLVEPLAPVATPPATPSGPASRIQRPRRQSQRYSKDDALGPVKLSYALKQCQNVLKQLMAHKYAWPFNSPVDWKLLNLPDYPEIIKHPMDLGTIKTQMETGCYENEEEFGDDVRLVWANALRYNQPGSDICIMAQELSDVFEGKFSKAMAAIGERKKTESSGVAETINELRDSMRSVQKELEMMRKLKASNGANKAPAKKEDSRPMTFEEKKKLSLAINNLPSESLGMVVKIIHERMPNLTGQGDEIEIDIDALDASTLRALERYIKTVSRKRTRNRPESPAKIEQATVTEAGTQSKIEDVERRLKELNEKAQAITQKTGIVVSPFETLPPEGVDAAIAPAQTTAPTSTQPEPAKPEPPAETQDSSDSESDSGSDSSDSDSDSDSDDSDSSDTDSEADHAAAQKAVESGAGMQSTPAVKQETVPTGNATSNPVALESEKAADGVGDESHQGIAPSSPSGEPKVVDIQNISAWAELGDSPQGHEKEASKSSDKTWSAFQNRKMLEQQREVERQEKEERLRREREQREEERRKAEEQRKREIEAREAQRLKEAQEAELEAQRERERLRLQAKLERERATQSINMTEQSMLMADFEQEAGVSSTPAILPMFQYKDVKDDDFDQMEEGELV